MVYIDADTVLIEMRKFEIYTNYQRMSGSKNDNCTANIGLGTAYS